MKDISSDVAYEFIRKRILSGAYSSGDALMTKDLAKEIGVSRTPVRDALRQLETDGLVEIRARQGARVKTMEFSDYRDLSAIRLALETYAAGYAAENHTGADLREMENALEAMRSLTRQVNAAEQEEPLLRELVLADARFHVAIMSAAKNELMKKEILRLHLINRVILGPSASMYRDPAQRPARDQRRLDVMGSHEEIFAAIARRDPHAARAAMEAHILELIEHNQELMARLTGAASTRELTEEELSYTA